MNERHEQFQEVLNKLYTLTVVDKIKFLEDLLFYLTIAGRGIWSDEQPTDAEKVEAFKWLNELLHRIWNIRLELQNGEGADCVTTLYENIKFYGDQSTLLRMHLVPTTLGAFNIFKGRQNSMSTMTKIYPQLGQTFDEQLKSALHEIGFTSWIHLRKEESDDKVRLTWTYPFEGHKEWFNVLLVVENGQLFIDMLRNPLGDTFDKADINGLIRYIKDVVKKRT
jgi:hypothetical protein